MRAYKPPAVAQTRENRKITQFIYPEGARRHAFRLEISGANGMLFWQVFNRHGQLELYSTRRYKTLAGLGRSLKAVGAALQLGGGRCGGK